MVALDLPDTWPCYSIASFDIILSPPFMDSVIIPLVKNKHGDLMNIRATMVSNAMSNIFDNAR